MRKIAAFATCAFVACVIALVGCAREGTLTHETIAETGALRVTADNASEGADVAAKGAVTLKEGDALLVSPDLQSGRLEVTLRDASGKTAFDMEASGRVLDTHAVAPGTYDVGVTCKETGTTGALVVSAVSANEFKGQTEALDAALAEVTDNATAQSASGNPAATAATTGESR